jgi:PAS domain S-box-containing protein
MPEPIREAGIRHVDEVTRDQRSLVEKALYMRCQSYLASIKAQLLTRTIFEVDGHRKELRQVNDILRDTMDTLQRQQQELATEVAYRRAIFHNSSAGILVVDGKRAIREVNQRLVEMTGYSEAELVGRSAALLHPNQDAFEAFRDRLLNCPPDAPRHHLEYPLRRKDGSSLWCDISGRPIDPRRPDQDMVCVCVDLSERKAAEAELIRAREAAEMANRAKSAFLANMSHELRTPLNAMLGFAQILQRDQRLGESQQQALETIRRSGDHLLTLINDVLDLAKIEAGRFELVPSPCRLPEFLRGVAELFRIRAQQGGLRFRFTPAASLPPMVEVDERRLRQILMNLLGNAVKFTEQGEVGLSADYGDGWLRLEVADTGVGIDPRRLPNLFQPFQQEGEARYKSRGTGLGLAISKSLAEQMGGSIEVESRPGRGSRFRVSLPLPPVLGAEVRGPGRNLLSSLTGYRRRDGAERPCRVLIVEDSMINQLVLDEMLSPLGFAVDLTERGEEALSLARRTPPDLVLMDLMLPGIDGLETTRLLHQVPGLEQLPVIAVSASVFPEDRRHSLEAGCRLHIAKPVDAGELLEALERLLDLEWQYIREPEPLPAPPAPVAALAASPLDEAQRAELMALARRGSIRGLRERLEQLGGNGDPLWEDLRQAAQRLDLRRIRELLAGPRANSDGGDEGVGRDP